MLSLAEEGSKRSEIFTKLINNCKYDFIPLPRPTIHFFFVSFVMKNLPYLIKTKTIREFPPTEMNMRTLNTRTADKARCLDKTGRSQ